jgi:hypothetical protein
MLCWVLALTVSLWEIIPRVEAKTRACLRSFPALCCLLWLLPTVSAQCSAGQYRTSSTATCINCIAGRYSSAVGDIAACTACIAGTYSTGVGMTSVNTCVNCVAGTYSATSALSTCTNCVAGTYGTGVGVTLASSCIRCQAGSYSSTLGAPNSAACTLCWGGTYSSGTGMSTSTACTKCLAGKFATGLGVTQSAVCTDCQSGFYTISGLTACIPCSAATSSGVSAGKCTSNAGYYDLGGSMMAYYPFNQMYWTNDIAGGVGALTASNAPYSNSSGPFGSDSFSYFTSGSPNAFILPTFTLPGNFTFSVWYYIDPTLNLVINYIATFPGPSSRVNDYLLYITSVPKGFILQNTFNSVSLGQGSYPDNLVRAVWNHIAVSISGPNGKMWINGVLVASFTFTGSRQTATSASNALGRHGTSASYYWKGGFDDYRIFNRPLTNAEVLAVYQFRGDSYTATFPILCSAGTFTNSPGASVCTECSAGSYSSGSGAIVCVACSGGRYSSGVGMTSSDACTSCGAGKYSTGTGMSLVASCTDCEVGKYSTGTGMSLVASCTDCFSGQYQSTAGASTCTVCQAGTYSSGTGMQLSSTCTLCSAGTYSTALGAASETACVACKSCGLQQAVNPCAAGSTNDTVQCVCTPGSFGPLCANCGAGTYSTGYREVECLACKSCDSSQMQASACPAGSSSDSVECLCQPGNYTTAPLLSPAVCSTCSAGTYASSYFATACLICGPGTYSSSLSASGCLNCSAGTYASSVNSSGCLNCSAGTYASSVSASLCGNCSAGTYTSGAGGSECVRCLAGSYASGGGASGCVNCSAGSFAPAGSGACQSCPGNLTSGQGSASCTCSAGYAQTGSSTSQQSFNVVTQRWYGQPGWYEGYGSPDFLVVNGYSNVSVMQGTVATFTVSRNGGAYPVMLFYNIPDLYLIGWATISPPDDIEYNDKRQVDMVNALVVDFYSLADFSSYAYTTGVTGQGTSTLVFDTANAPPGSYYLAAVSPSGYNTITLTVQVQSTAPITVNIPSTYSANALGVLGDTYVIAQNQYMGDSNLRLVCGPDNDVNDALATVFATGVGSLTFDTSVLIGQNTHCCWLLDSTTYPYLYFFFKERIGLSLSCSACEEGYRSNAGDDHCTQCGVGYYSANASQACTVCPSGHACASNTTASPTPCAAGAFAAAGASACVTCAAGAFAAAGASACVTCAAGTYSGGITCIPCPSHTTSLPGSKSALSCTCLAGYSCTYTKTLTLTLFLNLTTAYTPNNASGLLNSPIMASVAQAAGVPITNIKIGNISPIPSNRRSLTPSTHQVTVFLSSLTGQQEGALRSAGHEVTWADTVQVTRKKVKSL